MINFAIPSIRDGSEDGAEEVGEMLGATLNYKTTGNGDLWLTNVTNVTEQNKGSIVNCRRIAEWLTGKSFQRDAELVLNRLHKNITGRSWELMITLAMTSLLTGSSLAEGVTGTGRIGENGRILPVASYPEKILAARDAGYRQFLVSRDVPPEEKVIQGIRIVPIGDISQAWIEARDDYKVLEQQLYENLIRVSVRT